MAPQSNNGLLWAEAVIASLVRSGVDTFLVAPGSRSTPLVLAAARHPDVTTVVHFDERGAAFAAIGFARRSGRPAAVITTSGTAVANLLPAVVESSEDAVPLVLLTADRPAEMRKTGANQTIDQVGIFGEYVRFFADLESPDKDLSQHASLLVDRALTMATGRDPGPVHLNCQFRKPLQPDFDGRAAAASREVAAGRPPKKTESQSSDRGSRLAAGTESAEWPDAFCATDVVRIVVVAGRMDSALDAEKAVSLAKTLDCPLLADIGSQVPRTGAWPVVASPDTILRASDFASVPPALIVHVGGRFVSQRLINWLKRADLRGYVHLTFNDRPFALDGVDIRRLQYPVGDVSSVVRVRCDERWRERWRAASEIVTERLESSASDVLTERFIASEVWRLTPPDWGLLVGNSMPVRDFDSFGWGAAGPLFVATNRGASGIDGLVATAFGAALGNGPGPAYGSASGRASVIAVVGDQSLLHDLNSLALVAGSDQPVVVLVINNGGGGIFSMLPIAEHEDVFETHFAAAHGWSFENAAAQFGIAYDRADDAAGFRAALRRAVDSNASCVLEVRTNRAASQKDRLDFRRELIPSLAGVA